MQLILNPTRITRCTFDVEVYSPRTSYSARATVKFLCDVGIGKPKKGWSEEIRSRLVIDFGEICAGELKRVERGFLLTKIARKKQNQQNAIFEGGG